MTFGSTVFSCIRATSSPRTLARPIIYFILAILTAMPIWASVDRLHEIDPASVSATVVPGFDPVNGASVIFQWTTVDPGNSIVIIENNINLAGNENSPSRQIIQNDHTTNHVVRVDHFPVYSDPQTWGYYVASLVTKVAPHCPTIRAAICTFWATYPGPQTPGCGSPPAAGCGGFYLTFNVQYQYASQNQNGPLVFSLWPVGGQNVYQGDPTQSPACTPTSKSSRECNDLYVITQANLLSGDPSAVVLMQSVVITNTDTGQVVTDNSITAQYLCDLDANSNPPPQNWDGDYNSQSEACYNGALYTSNNTVRIRVNSQAVPGHYQFAAMFQGQLNGVDAGNAVPMTYNFKVLPTASFTATPPTTFPDIPGRSNWEMNMVNFNAPANSANADFWCTNVTDTNPWFSLDNGNFSGYFDIPSSNYFEAWNYDGGRVYQQVSDYDTYHQQQYKSTDPNEWQRCIQMAMEPYKDTSIGTNAGFVAKPNQFPFGMAMAYMRTGDSTYQNAIDLMAHSQAYNLRYSGSVYAESIRVSAYLMDDRLADEMVGFPRNNAFMLRAVDVMLGYLDQSYNLNFNNPNQQEYDIHPFMVGLAMEALITYYELDLAEGNTPDARIPLEIKKTLDWLKNTQYMVVPPPTISHAFAYGAYDLPRDPRQVAGTLYQSTELNDLVAPAYAWYWYKTGDTSSLNLGDDAFQHVWDSASGQNQGGDGGWTWSVKEYNQVYKWSFDYVRWRSGQNPDGSAPPIEDVLPAANPYTGPVPDYAPPVQFVWNAATNGQVSNIDPRLEDSANTVVVNGTTATFWFNLFKPNTTVTIYYGYLAIGYCDPWNPQPPLCMQPYPNFGLLDALNANYAYQSQSTMDFQDQTALSQGIPNIYDATVTVTGLLPNTQYHWRPLAVDASGNMASYYDLTFITGSQ